MTAPRAVPGRPDSEIRVDDIEISAGRATPFSAPDERVNKLKFVPTRVVDVLTSTMDDRPGRAQTFSGSDGACRPASASFTSVASPVDNGD